jgi:hypothetical protein
MSRPVMVIRMISFVAGMLISAAPYGRAFLFADSSKT